MISPSFGFEITYRERFQRLLKLRETDGHGDLDDLALDYVYGTGRLGAHSVHRLSELLLREFELPDGVGSGTSLWSVVRWAVVYAGTNHINRAISCRRCIAAKNKSAGIGQT